MSGAVVMKSAENRRFLCSADVVRSVSVHAIDGDLIG